MEAALEGSGDDVWCCRIQCHQDYDRLVLILLITITSDERWPFGE